VQNAVSNESGYISANIHSAPSHGAWATAFSIAKMSIQGLYRQLFFYIDRNHDARVLFDAE
jgi:hypothetical protein